MSAAPASLPRLGALAAAAAGGALAVLLLWRLSAPAPPPRAPLAAVSGLCGLRVLLTGGTSGIGAAAARALRAGGARVVFCGRRADRGAALEAALRARTPGDGGDGGAQPGAVLAKFVLADVRSPDACAALFAAAEHALGGVDALVNCAGVVAAGALAAGSDAASAALWADVLDVNLLAPLRLMRLALPGMRARRSGAVVNVASDWALTGARGYCAYATSKAALLQLTRCAALEHARDGIKINALCPGDTAVDRWRTDGYASGGGGPVSDAQAAADARALPLGRACSEDEVARALVFLVARGTESLTGSALVIDGGNTAAGASHCSA
jgi:meso-butanediol dehydrogenase/(S,S)-butanediol dehydrogenase/diacetyl reductase